MNYHDFAVASGAMPLSERRIPMSDGAGEVIAVGSGVNEFAVGDHVVSTFFPQWLDGEVQTVGFDRVPGDGIDGFAREQVTMPSTAFTRAPNGYSHAEAATLTTAGLTAWRALFENAHLKPGETVLVQGTGGVSIFALQLAKLAGARVIATSSSNEKLAKLTAMGADAVINYRDDPEWGRTAHRLEALAVGNRRQQQDFVRAIEATGLRPVIDRHFPLDDIVAAFQYQASGKHFGKIVLDI